MTIKTITIFLAVMMLSLNALAFESEEGAENRSREQLTAVGQTVYYPNNIRTASFEPAGNKNQSNATSTRDKQGELFIEICVYITIIMIYSIFWLLMPAESNNSINRE